jgi:glycosyltransferase involved in cell wall biosynthesis
MMNYSVIIPHKNCLDLLCRCLGSIPNRADIEVVVVDDNSGIDDIEGQIRQNSDLQNLKVLVLPESRFAGGARNMGLNVATGRWLVFMDADDFFTSNAFDIMDCHLDSEHDIIFFGHSAAYSDTLEPAERLGGRLKYIEEYSRHQTRKSEDYLRYINHSPIAKMIRRSMVVEYNLKFDEVPASNDAMFTVTTGYYAKSIMADNGVVYCATIRRGSLTQTRNKVNAYSRYSVEVALYVFFRDKGLSHLYPFLTSWCVNALRYYGVKEFIKYISLAHKHRVNIFLGITRRFNSKYKY